MHVVPNGAEPRPLQDVARSPLTLCTLSRLVPHKRLEQAVDVAVALAGASPRRYGCGSSARAGGSPSCGGTSRAAGPVTWWTLVGRVDADERDRELAAAAVMLLPSVREGWGLAVIEAALQGTPTVAYRSAGGVGESVRHDETGLLVDTPPSSSEPSERLVTEPELRHRLSQAGREWALSFDWDETASAVEALVERLADGQVAGLP